MLAERSTVSATSADTTTPLLPVRIYRCVPALVASLTDFPRCLCLVEKGAASKDPILHKTFNLLVIYAQSISTDLQLRATQV